MGRFLRGKIQIVFSLLVNIKGERSVFIMKKFLYILIALMAFMPMQSGAFQNVPDGFQDFSWGDSFEKIKQKYFILHSTDEFGFTDENSGIVLLINIKTAQNLDFLGFPISDDLASVEFEDNKLVKLSINFTGDGIIEQLKKALMQTFGEPDEYTPFSYTWHGATTDMLLVTDKTRTVQNFCTVIFRKK